MNNLISEILHDYTLRTYLILYYYFTHSTASRVCWTQQQFQRRWWHRPRWARTQWWTRVRGAVRSTTYPAACRAGSWANACAACPANSWPTWPLDGRSTQGPWPETADLAENHWAGWPCGITLEKRNIRQND